MKHVFKGQGKSTSKLDVPRTSLDYSVSKTSLVTHSRKVKFTIEQTTKAQKGSRGI